MSKKRPTTVFIIRCRDGRAVNVLARSRKGALSVLQEHGYSPMRTPGGEPDIRIIDDGNPEQCINVRLK